VDRLRLAFVCIACAAATAGAAAQDLPASLRVKPELCITDKRGQACETSFLVRWESELIGFYCLTDDLSTTPLRCWEQKSSGKFDEDRVVTQSFSYLLTASEHEQPLAAAKVVLMTIDSSDRRRSRRNRHAWSVR
jgi:hypothetical protein